jgi:hypothetical protein
MLSNFIQVLNSARDVYTKNYYFFYAYLIYYNFFTTEIEIKS